MIGRAEAKFFLADKPVSLLWGVGKAMQKRLGKDGILRIGELARIDEANLSPVTARSAEGCRCAHGAKTTAGSTLKARPRACRRKPPSTKILPTRPASPDPVAACRDGGASYEKDRLRQ